MPFDDTHTLIVQRLTADRHARGWLAVLTARHSHQSKLAHDLDTA